MTGKSKVGKVSFVGDAPMAFSPHDNGEFVKEPSPETSEAMNAVRACIKAYLHATESLIAGKYSGIAEFSPGYLAHPGNVLIGICSDGVVVRYESKRSEERTMAVANMPHGIAQASLNFSQNLIKLSGQGTLEIDPRELGVEIRMSTFSPTEGKGNDIFSARVLFDVVRPDPVPMSTPPNKPYCLLSIRNQLAIEIHGEIRPVEGSNGPSQAFVSKADVALGVGWQCIEVFPGFDLSAWRAEYAPLWAETDLLGCVVINQQQVAEEHSLDPRATTRRQYASLLAEFKFLLDSDPDREQTLQTFLQAHPELLCPGHVHMWPKLPFGRHITDFVFRDAVNDYVLVELERSTLALFRQDGHASADLTHAHGQILDWKRYLEDNLHTVQRELGLTGISTNPNGLVVIGRSADLTIETRRKLKTMTNDTPKLRIMTYDDVYDNAKAVLENILGPMTDIGGTTRIFYPPINALRNIAKAVPGPHA